MPQMANIVIKKADGTTDVTYTAAQPSSGDKTAARWQSLTVGTTPAERPVLALRAESNGPGTARRITGSFKWPMTSQDAGGNLVVAGGTVGTFQIVVPQNQTTANITEQAHQFANLIASTLMKQCFIDGYAPS